MSTTELLRRAWARNPGAIEAIKDAMNENPSLEVTIPNITDDAIFDGLLGDLMGNSVFLDGNTLSPAEVMAIATGSAKLEITQDSWDRIINSRKVVESILKSGEVVYGINTGFGSLVNTTIDSEKLQELQVNLIRSHATGLGEKMDKISVRTMMIARVNSFAPKVTQESIQMLFNN